jgi:hypothetical protein
MRRHAFLAGVAFAVAALTALPAAAQKAEDVLKRASDAIGAGEVKSIRYAGTGTGYTFGQAYKPGAAWPKIAIESMTRTINYETGSMRTVSKFSRAEPKNGGGYPLTGSATADQYLSGAVAWNLMGQNVQPGARFVNDRTHQLWITPHGAIKAAIKNKTKVSWRTQGEKKVAVLSFTEPGRFSARVTLDDKFQVARVDSRLPDATLGEVSAVTTYSGYKTFGAAKFPTRIKQSQGGFPVLDLTVKEVQPNAPADFQAPEPARTAIERVTTEKVADGV